MKCDKCKKEIKSEDTYIELQTWEMYQGDGEELCDTRLCYDCFDDVTAYIQGNKQ